MKCGSECVELAFPGTEDIVVYTSDTFCLPQGAKNVAGAQRLLATLGSREGQDALNRAKGSLARRSDVEVPRDPLMAHKSRLLKTGRLVLSLAGIVPVRFGDALDRASLDMIQQRDIEPMVHMLRSRYALLR